MRFKTLFMLTALTAVSCNDSILLRSDANYFPLLPGSSWQYLRGEDTVYVTVDTLSSVILNQPCTRVYRNFAPAYFLAGPTEVRRLSVGVISRPGGEDTVEYRFALLYQLPLVLGNVYNDAYDTTLIWGPDTLNYHHTLNAQVAAIESVATPAGVFYDCYRIDFTETTAARETTQTAWREWLAPGTGVVRRQGVDFEEILVKYQR